MCGWLPWGKAPEPAIVDLTSRVNKMDTKLTENQRMVEHHIIQIAKGVVNNEVYQKQFHALQVHVAAQDEEIAALKARNGFESLL